MKSTRQKLASVEVLALMKDPCMRYYAFLVIVAALALLIAILAQPGK